ncbi:MAG TPA: alpha/beta fold hydrolase [Candidatus Dormibacteraeota bacterium]|nr:alpha/beta fold hydrolase [Candidatus Dormibacteraeota bacterium]
MDVTLRQVDLHGARYTYAEAGRGDALLLIHGWAGSWENFEPWLPTLARRFRVIAPDLPGCHGAPPLQGRHDAAGYADFCDELLHAIDAAPAHVGGLCSGASIALEMASRHPDDVRGLLLHTPLFAQATTPFFRRQIRLFASRPMRPLLTRMRHLARVTRLYKTMFIDRGRVVPARDAIDQRNMAMVHPRAARELAVDLLVDRFAHVQRWTGPLFIIVPSEDSFVRCDALATLGLPEGVVHIIEGGGHGWDEPFLRLQDEILAKFTSA